MMDGKRPYHKPVLTRHADDPRGREVPHMGHTPHESGTDEVDGPEADIRVPFDIERQGGWAVWVDDHQDWEDGGGLTIRSRRNAERVAAAYARMGYTVGLARVSFHAVPEDVTIGEVPRG